MARVRISLLFLAAAFAAAAAPGERLLVGRYPNWGRHAGFPADKVPYGLLTHLLYASFVSDGTGFVRNSDPLDEANFRDLVARAHAQGVKVSLSVEAGAGAGSPFEAMARRPGARERFIRNCLSLLDAYGLDGIDLAWDLRTPGDGDSRLLLLRELRAALDKHARKPILSSQVGAADRWAGRLADEFFTLPDYLVVLASQHEAGGKKIARPVAGMEESRAALRHFEKRGVPAGRLLMESAFFGRSYDGASGLGSAYFGRGSGNEGCWRWKDLLVRLRKTGYRIQWDAASRSEVALGDGEVIAFNGIPAQRARGEFIRGSDFAGVAVPDLASDTLDTGKSLLVALRQGLLGSASAPILLPAALPGVPGTRTESRPETAALLQEWLTDFPAPGLALSHHPAGRVPPPTLVDSLAREGSHSLEVALEAQQPAGCALCLPSPVDLAGAYSAGYLELWVRGASGDEAFHLSLRDDGVNAARRPLSVAVNSRSFGVILRGEWTLLRIPLKAFGTRGAWSPGRQAPPAFQAFHWGGVRCLALENEPGRQKQFRIWLDGIRMVRGPAPAAPLPGYTATNEAARLPGAGS